MRESSRTKVELLAEIADLKRKIKKLEKLAANCKRVESQIEIALEAMRESEERQQLILSTLPIAIFTSPHNPDIDTSWVSGDVEKVTGFTVDQYLAEKDFWRNRLHADDRERVLAAYSNQTKCEEIVLEYRWLCKDGNYKWYYDRTIKKRTPQGIQYFGIILDITERKLAEEALKESENKYRELVDNSPDAIAIYVEGKIVFANNECLHLMGAANAAELIGKSVIQFIHPDCHTLVIERMKKVANERTVLPLAEEKFVRLDGSAIDVEVLAMPIMFENKPAVQLIIRNITARKQAEEEKRILEERLQWVDKMESIGTLAGGIAHDFNNLLMGIQGYASLSLLNLDSTNSNYERIKRIEEQVQSGANLTSQLLGFARGGKYEVKPTDMNEIIAKTSSMFGRTKKEISIHRKHAQNLWNVEVDRGQMEQVFLNLYVNAWQAMPGGGDISLESENVILKDEQMLPFSVKPGKYVKITTSDTGIGMDEKTRERIFDPFFTTKEMGRGAGLGLATVYGIIKGHQGMINVYSEPDHGTTFTIYLPASEKAVVKEETVTGKVVSGSETILLVEDEKMILEVNREMLESLGYRIYAVGSGQEGIALFMEKTNEIDLIILDMIMPGISGSETFDRLREINPNVKILLSSGYSLNGEAQHIIDRGCNGFLQKPFQIERLSQKVREILEI